LAKKNFDVMEPLDLTMFGGPEDPCFGKHHDLKAEECKMCGDAELCAIAVAQNRKKQRAEIEAKQPFKDLEDKPPSASTPRIKKYMQKKQLKGIPKKSIIRRAIKRFTITHDQAENIFKQL
jgi:hypothetical protein